MLQPELPRLLLRLEQERRHQDLHSKKFTVRAIHASARLIFLVVRHVFPPFRAPCGICLSPCTLWASCRFWLLLKDVWFDAGSVCVSDDRFFATTMFSFRWIYPTVATAGIPYTSELADISVRKFPTPRERRRRHSRFPFATCGKNVPCAHRLLAIVSTS